MLKRPGTRRFLAALGIVLGVIFGVGVIWSIAAGETEWWSAVLLLPAVLIVYRLYRLWVQIGRNRGS